MMQKAAEELTRLATFTCKYKLLPSIKEVLDFLEDIKDTEAVTLRQLMVLYLKIASIISNEFCDEKISVAHNKIENKCKEDDILEPAEEDIDRKLQEIKERIENLEIINAQSNIAVDQANIVNEASNYIKNSKTSGIIAINLKPKNANNQEVFTQSEELESNNIIEEPLNDTDINVDDVDVNKSVKSLDVKSNETLLTTNEHLECQESMVTEIYEEQTQQSCQIAYCPELQKVFNKVEKCNPSSRIVLEDNPSYNKILNSLKLIMAKTKFNAFTKRRRYRNNFDTSGFKSWTDPKAAFHNKFKAASNFSRTQNQKLDYGEKHIVWFI